MVKKNYYQTHFVLLLTFNLNFSVVSKLNTFLLGRLFKLVVVSSAGTVF